MRITVYLYSAATDTLIARIHGPDLAACERVAEQHAANADDYWTREPLLPIHRTRTNVSDLAA